MQLTQEQLDTVRQGNSIRLTESNTDLVVVRADVFERLQASQYEDDSWTDDEMALLAAEDANRLGWEGMDAYQDDQK